MALLLTTDEEAQINCQSCCLFGDPSAMQRKWANGVSSNPKNFEVKIKLHKKTQEHLDAIIAFGRWKRRRHNASTNRQSRQRRPSDHKHCYDTLCACHCAGTANTWAMATVTVQLSRACGDASVIRPGSESYFKPRNTTIQTEKCLSQGPK